MKQDHIQEYTSIRPYLYSENKKEFLEMRTTTELNSIEGFFLS